MLVIEKTLRAALLPFLLPLVALSASCGGADLTRPPEPDQRATGDASRPVDAVAGHDGSAAPDAASGGDLQGRSDRALALDGAAEPDAPASDASRDAGPPDAVGIEAGTVDLLKPDAATADVVAPDLGRPKPDLALAPDSGTPQPTKLLFYDGFESGTHTPNWALSLQNLDGVAGFSVTRAFARSGTFAAHFQADRSRRSELSGAPNSGYVWGREYWVGFSMMVPVATPAGILSQHHATPGIGSDGKTDWSCVAGPNGFTIVSNDGKLDLRTTTTASLVNTTPAIGSALWGTSVKASVPLVVGKWYDFVLHFKYAPDSSGFFEVWLDRKQLFSHKGVTTYTKDLCGKNRTERNYQKIGIYTSSGGTGAVVYDEFRIGDRTASLAAVSPR